MNFTGWYKGERLSGRQIERENFAFGQRSVVHRDDGLVAGRNGRGVMLRVESAGLIRAFRSRREQKPQCDVQLLGARFNTKLI